MFNSLQDVGVGVINSVEHTGLSIKWSSVHTPLPAGIHWRLYKTVVFIIIHFIAVLASLPINELSPRKPGGHHV